jgi:hypothetical protein
MAGFQEPTYEFGPQGKILAAVGYAFYGENWKNRLADDLDIRERSFQRWLPGHAPVPSGIWRMLLELIDERVGDLAEARELIERELGR